MKSIIRHEIKKIGKEFASKWVLISIFVIVAIFIACSLYLSPTSRVNSVVSKDTKVSTVESLQVLPSDSFSVLQSKFKDYAERNGGRAAFEILKTTTFPPNIDVHLLGHAIGDVLYKQEGANGMTACTNDFRNACSHAIVVGLFGDKGEAALPEIIEACKNAPGGSGAYTMCFHGLGHGVLSYFGYSFEKAAPVCAATGTEAHHNQEVSECLGGMVMEIIEGGAHDKDIWSKQRPKYLHASKPLSLCQQDFVPTTARYMCYVYLTPYLFEVAGGDLGNLTPDVYEKSFSYCATLPETDAINRDACFGGFGKEFVGVIQSRDARQSSLLKLTTDQMKKVYTWCALAHNKPGEGACIVHALTYLYWGGENDSKISLEFCSAAPDSYAQDTCYNNLFITVNAYKTDMTYKRQLCGEIPSNYTNACKRVLGVENI